MLPLPIEQLLWGLGSGCLSQGKPLSQKCTFLLVKLSVSDHSQFLQGSAMMAFPTAMLSCSTPTWAFSTLCSTPSSQAQGKYSICIWTPILSRELQFHLCENVWFPPQQIVCHVHQAGLQNCLVKNGSATGQCRQVEDKGFALAALFVQFSAL
jgi:hypothetical protein